MKEAAQEEEERDGKSRQRVGCESYGGGEVRRKRKLGREGAEERG